MQKLLMLISIDGAGADIRAGRMSLLFKLAGSLGSGIISALCLTLIASQRITTIDPHIGVTILLFIQWQVLGLTVAKLGIDQAIFSVVSRNNAVRFSISEFILAKALPLSIAAAVVIGVVFSPAVGLIAGASILVDTFSTMAMADLNARGRFGVTALANLLNYPMFFVLLVVVSLSRTGIEIYVLLFLITSGCRALWLLPHYRRNEAVEAVRFRGAPALAAQQTLNYLLFRGDQLLLVLVSTFGLSLASSIAVDEYVYLGKFPELASSGLVILGFFLFPRIKVSPGFASLPESVRISTAQMFIGVVVSALLVIAYGIYQSPLIASGVLGDVPRAVSLAFVLQTLLVLPVNAITYVLLGEGYARLLIQAQGIGLFVAGLIAALALEQGSLTLLAWTVPLQLVLFVVATVVLKPSADKQQLLYA